MLAGEVAADELQRDMIVEVAGFLGLVVPVGNDGNNARQDDAATERDEVGNLRRRVGIAILI